MQSRKLLPLLRGRTTIEITLRNLVDKYNLSVYISDSTKIPLTTGPNVKLDLYVSTRGNYGNQ